MSPTFNLAYIENPIKSRFSTFRFRLFTNNEIQMIFKKYLKVNLKIKMVKIHSSWTPLFQKNGTLIQSIEKKINEISVGSIYVLWILFCGFWNQNFLCFKNAKTPESLFSSGDACGSD